jgi:hypothetical protein
VDNLDSLLLLPGRLDALTAEIAAMRNDLARLVPAAEDGYLRFAEAVKFSGIGRTRLEQLVAAGRLSVRRNGRARLVSKRELVELLESGNGGRGAPRC